MANVEVTTNEIMYFLEKNMVTRGEFVDFKEEVYYFRDEFYDFKNDTETRFSHIENQMVTKDYLDDKFADFGAEIGKKINRQTERHEILVDILAEKSILQETDIERLKK